MASEPRLLKLATLLENPAEPPTGSRYLDPTVLADYGYNGVVLYATTALSGVASAEVIQDGELRRWVSQLLESTALRIETCRRAGLAVYLSYDVIVLPYDVVTQHQRDVTVRGRHDLLDPSSDKAIDLSVGALESLLNQLPAVDGVVLRMGDTDARRMPHLIGNDVYRATPEHQTVDVVSHIIDRFHQPVVDQRGLRLIVRAWNVRPGGIHDRVELAQAMAQRLPGEVDDDRLVMCFKFTQRDFRRYEVWNPSSLVFGQRPILYEVQCQREFEGKGGIPNWQVPLWKQGPTEVDGPPMGLQDACESVRFAGVLAWVRGGGWGGPFVGCEDWIDANVWTLPRLVDAPASTAESLAKAWIDERFNARRPTVAVLTDILMQSAELARLAFYIGPTQTEPGEVSSATAEWIQDDLLDVQVLWRLLSRMPDAGLDAAVREKAQAAEQISALRARLQQNTDGRHQSALEVLSHTLLYTESLYEALRDLVTGLVHYRRWQRTHTATLASRVRQSLLASQSHWMHHTQRYGSLSGTATPFRERGFWEMTENVLTKVGETERKKEHV